MQAVMHISEVLAETFKAKPTPENLTAWVDAPIKGQLELNLEAVREQLDNPLTFCDEVNSEFVREVSC